MTDWTPENEIGRLRATVAEWPELLPGGLSSNGARDWLRDRVDELLDPTKCSTCGAPEGFHDDGIYNVL